MFKAAGFIGLKSVNIQKTEKTIVVYHAMESHSTAQRNKPLEQIK